jgi:hypothetical protein
MNMQMFTRPTPFGGGGRGERGIITCQFTNIDFHCRDLVFFFVKKLISKLEIGTLSSLGNSNWGEFITSFRFITMPCGIDNIPENIRNEHGTSLKIFPQCCHSHATNIVMNLDSVMVGFNLQDIKFLLH